MGVHTLANIKLALPTIFKHEGFLSNSPSDPGGITNYGISLRFLMQTGDLNLDGWRDGDINKDGRINSEDIKSLTREKAAEIYELYFWKPNRYGEIDDQKVATKIFDIAVNTGSYSANKILQRAIRSAVRLRLVEDGQMGNNTLRGVEMCKPDLLYTAIKSEAAGYYRSIRYEGSKDFIEGWLNRAYDDVLLEVSK